MSTTSEQTQQSISRFSKAQTRLLRILKKWAPEDGPCVSILSLKTILKDSGAFWIARIEGDVASERRVFCKTVPLRARSKENRVMVLSSSLSDWLSFSNPEMEEAKVSSLVDELVALSKKEEAFRRHIRVQSQMSGKSGSLRVH